MSKPATFEDMIRRLETEIAYARTDWKIQEAFLRVGVAIGIGIDEDAAAECARRYKAPRLTRYGRTDMKERVK